jgi:hypothetical protein
VFVRFTPAVFISRVNADGPVTLSGEWRPERNVCGHLALQLPELIKKLPTSRRSPLFTPVFTEIPSQNIIQLNPDRTITSNFFYIDFIVGFQVLTAVTMKNSVFWDVAPCRSCMNRRFGGTYRLHLQGRKIRERGTSVNTWLLYYH